MAEKKIATKTKDLKQLAKKQQVTNQQPGTMTKKTGVRSGWGRFA
jgi:hypothetical protein